MDNRGSGTLEIMIVLVIIVLIMGTALTSYENSTKKIVSAEEKENTNHMISEIADNLINNPGLPDNWYETEKGTPGLAIVNEEGQIIPNSISWQKYCALGENYKKLVSEKIFNSKIKSSMELIPQKSSISSVKIGSDDEGGTVYTLHRFVRCDFYKKYVLKDFENGGKCNRNHKQSDHSCNYFKIFKGNLKKSDYYILIDSYEEDGLKYFIDTTRIVKTRDWQTVTSDEIYLNDEISFYDDTSAVVFIHFNKPEAKAVLVSVPKNFDKNNLDYDHFKTNDCEFILKAWY